MNHRIILPLVLGAFVASVPVLAADITPAQKCTALEKQFDQDIFPYHIASNPTSVEAKAMRDEGATMCTSGKTDDGLAKLRAALGQFGISPHA